MTTTIYLFEHINDKFTFGKYCGYTLSDVLDKNEEYVDWCMMNIDCFVLSNEAMDEIKKIYPDFIISSSFLLKQTLKSLELSDYEEDCKFDDECDYLTPAERYLKADNRDNEENDDWEEESTYDRYNGSYAQDEMGYSDDDIDTIFDGDSSAYWNID